jgi:hypothetical protein
VTKVLAIDDIAKRIYHECSNYVDDQITLSTSRINIINTKLL